MPPAPSRRPRKQAILRAVYEDNRAFSSGSPPKRASRGRRRKGPFGLGILLLPLLAIAAWGVSRMPASAGSPHAAEPSSTPSTASGSSERRDPRRRPSEANPAEAGVAELLNLQVRTIVIDPGHGGRDPGAVGPGRLEEKAVALDVARRLRDRLSRREELDVLLTREGDVAVGLEERVSFANEADADLFVSIHVNALPDTTLAPVETYFFGVDAGEPARALAHAENGGSTFSVAEFNAALRRAGTAVKLQESRELARAVQRALVRERAIGPRPASDWGAKPAPFGVLLYTEAPAVLTEITALSSPAEEARLRDPAYRDAVAAALEGGLLAYLRLPPPPTDVREEDR